MQNNDVEENKKKLKLILNIFSRIPAIIIGLVLFIEGIISLFVEVNRYTYVFLIFGSFCLITGLFIAPKYIDHIIELRYKK